MDQVVLTYLRVHTHTPFVEKEAMDLKESMGSIWEGLERGKGRRKYNVISKKK